MFKNNLNMKIDDEWDKFLSGNLNSDDEPMTNNSNINDNYNTENNKEFDNDADDDDDFIIIKKNSNQKKNGFDKKNNINTNVPKPSDIYISTKTKIAYLNKMIDLKNVFWNIPIIPYTKPQEGVIKKQMKFNSLYEEELQIIKENLKKERFYDEYVITSINNPTGRIKFKDVRKISIGMSKKDLLSHRSKQKSAFYNCFVMILRLDVDGIFKEFHVKVFNTGKMELPGIQDEETFNILLDHVIQTIKPYTSDDISYDKETIETVLINSNFNCGYYVNRDKLYDLLKYKYNIQSIYDPCTYPGIQCKFYFNPDINIQTGSQISEENKHLYKNVCQVSFMIFRTGSVLIVGRCDESVLIKIYEFLKKMLIDEYKTVGKCLIDSNKDSDSVCDQDDGLNNPNNLKKMRKKTINISVSIGKKM